MNKATLTSFKSWSSFMLIGRLRSDIDHPPYFLYRIMCDPLLNLPEVESFTCDDHYVHFQTLLKILPSVWISTFFSGREHIRERQIIDRSFGEFRLFLSDSWSFELGPDCRP